MSDPGGTSPDPGGTDDSSKASEQDKEGTVVADDGQIKTGEDPSNGTKKQLSRSAKWNKNETNVQPAVKDQTNPDKDKVDAARFQQQPLSPQMKQKVKNNLDNVGSSTAEERRFITKKGGLFVKPLVDDFEANKKKDEESSVGRGDSPQSEDYAEKQGFEVIVDNGTDKLIFKNNLDHADGHIKNDASFEDRGPGCEEDNPNLVNSFPAKKKARAEVCPNTGELLAVGVCPGEDKNIDVFETSDSDDSIEVIDLTSKEETENIVPSSGSESLQARTKPLNQDERLEKNKHTGNGILEGGDLLYDEHACQIDNCVNIDEVTVKFENMAILENDETAEGIVRTVPGEIIERVTTAGKKEVEGATKIINSEIYSHVDSSKYDKETQERNTEPVKPKMVQLGKKSEDGANESRPKIVPKPAPRRKKDENKEQGEVCSASSDPPSQSSVDENVRDKQICKPTAVLTDSRQEASSNSLDPDQFGNDVEENIENKDKKEEYDTDHVSFSTVNGQFSKVVYSDCKKIDGEIHCSSRYQVTKQSDAPKPGAHEKSVEDTKSNANAKYDGHPVLTNPCKTEKAENGGEELSGSGAANNLENPEEKKIYKILRVGTKVVVKSLITNFETKAPQLSKYKNLEVHDDYIEADSDLFKIIERQGKISLEKLPDAPDEEHHSPEKHLDVVYEKKENSSNDESTEGEQECKNNRVMINESNMVNTTNSERDEQQNKTEGTSLRKKTGATGKFKVTVRLQEGKHEVIEEKSFKLTIAQYMKYQFAFNNPGTLKRISEKYRNTHKFKLLVDEHGITLVCCGEIDKSSASNLLKKSLQFFLEEMKNIREIGVPAENIDHTQIISNVRQSDIGKFGEVFVYYDEEEKMIYFSFNESMREQVLPLTKPSNEPVQLTMQYIFIYLLDTDDIKTTLLEEFPDVALNTTISENRYDGVVTFSGNYQRTKQCKIWCENNIIDKYTRAHSSCKTCFPENSNEQECIDRITEFLEFFFKDIINIYHVFDKQSYRVWIYSELDQKEVDPVNRKLQEYFQQGIVKERIAILEGEKIKDIFEMTQKQFTTVKVNKEGAYMCLTGSSNNVQIAKTAVTDKLKTNQEPPIIEIMPSETENQTIETDKPTPEKHFGDLWQNIKHVRWLFPRDNHLVVGEIDANSLQHKPVIFLTDQNSPNGDEIPDCKKSPLSFVIKDTTKYWEKGKHDLSSQMKTVLLEIEKNPTSDILVVVKDINKSKFLKAVLPEIFQWLQSKDKLKATVFFGCSTAGICKTLMEIILDALPSMGFKVNNPFQRVETDVSLQVILQTGQIAEKKADVIVNPTDLSFKLNRGGVSQSILNAGGEELQDAVTTKKTEDVAFGDIIVTERCGQLSCKFVFHGALQKYQNKEDLEKLKEFVMKCLKKADGRGCTSIAFPAIGTAKLGFNTKDVAKTMFDAVVQFSQGQINNPWVELNEVYIVIFDKGEYYQDFERVAVKHSQLTAQIDRSEPDQKDQSQSKSKAFTVKKVPNIQVADPPQEQVIDRGHSDTDKHERKKVELDSIPEMKRFVKVSGIPTNTKKESLLSQLQTLGMQNNPSLIYCDDMDTALLICNNELDSAHLSKYTDGPLKFRLLDKECLRNVKSSCTHEILTGPKNQRLVRLIEELHYIGVQLDPDKRELKTCTMFQLTCANNIIKKHIQEVSDSTRCKETRENSFTEIPDPIRIPVCSPIVWSYLKAKYPIYIADFEHVYGEVSCKINSKTEIVIPSAAGDKKIDAFVNTLQRYINSIDIFQAEVEPAYFDEVEKWCEVMRKEKKFCQFDRFSATFIACSDSYEEGMKVKHQFKIKTKKVKPTPSGRNRHKGEESSEDLENIEKSNKKKDFPIARKHSTTKPVDLMQVARNLMSFSTSENITIYVYEADILKLPVDCIVNAANSTLSHGAGVAYAIAKAAGPCLTDEGNRFINENGNLNVGDVYSTSAGALDYNYVIHTVGPRWSDYDRQNQRQCKEDLYYAIYNCFKEAEAKDQNTIALPAVSSALFGVPTYICVEQYVRATLQYSRESHGKSSCLSEIHFVDIKNDIVRSIQDEFKKHLPGQGTIREAGKKDAKAGNMNDQTTETLFTDRTEVTETLFYCNEKSGQKRKTFVFANNCLHICCGDIFNEKASSIVVTLDETGRGGKLKTAVEKKIPQEYKDLYKRNFDHKITSNRKERSVFFIDGYSCGYSRIYNVVYPRRALNQPEVKRKEDLLEIFSTLFQLINENIRSPLNSVVTPQFGIGKGKGEPQLWSEAFQQSFIAFCEQRCAQFSKYSSQIELIVVCETNEAHSVLCDVFEKFHANNAKAPRQVPFTEKKTAEQEMMTGIEDADMDVDAICVICQDKFTDPKALRCGHVFCNDCIEQQFKYNKKCPSCGKVCGIITGDQPKGRMSVRVDKWNSLLGFEYCSRIVISYSFQDGIQQENHPMPGKSYKGIYRTAYLPDNEEGRKILRMLQVAFERKLVFTIGSSRTTGHEGVITWNDIHHKTDLRPNSQFGYPDPTYLQRVKEELELKGVTEQDIPSHSGSVIDV